MARSRPEKKRDEKTAQPAEQRVLPMQLQVGDRITAETAEWEVIGQPYTSGGGKNAHARLRKVGDPASIGCEVGAPTSVSR
jgi:hypothetical protein